MADILDCLMTIPAHAPVVAVVVTCNPGAWLDETFQSLAAQDYPNLATLVIDAASAQDPLPRVAAILPGAYIRRLRHNRGYADAANRALRIVEGAAFLLLCHDDIALFPDALSRMMDQAARSGAGIVSPKLVDWDNPRMLRQLGGSVDRTGTYVPVVEPGDLDQGQHDLSTETFIAPGGCTLIRADLFAALNGYDPDIALYGDDVDLSMRAQIAGARIVTAPAAVVRHLEASAKSLRLPALLGPVGDVDHDHDDVEGPGAASPDELRHRHRLRTMFKIRRNWAVVGTVAKLALFDLGVAVYSLALGKPSRAAGNVRAWIWNLMHWRSLGRQRNLVQHSRHRSDHELRKQFASTRARVGAIMQLDLAERRARSQAQNHRHELVGALRRLPVAVWATLLVIWLLGSRGLLVGGLPAVGQFVPLAASGLESLRQYFAVTSADGFGLIAPSSPGHLLIGLAQLVTLGANGVLHKALVVGTLPLGVFGMSRLAKPLGSSRARLVAMVVYVAIPLPYDALGAARWDGLLAYAAAPWLLRILLQVQGADPYRHGREALSRAFHRRRKLTEDEDLETLVVSDLDDLFDAGGGLAPSAGERGRLASAAALLEGRELSGDKPPDRHVGAGLEGAVLSAGAEPTRQDRLWYLLVRRVLPAALLLGVVGAFAAQFILAALLATVGLLLAMPLTAELGRRGPRAGPRALGARALGAMPGVAVIAVATAATAVALGLLLPGMLGADAGWHALVRVIPTTSMPHGLGVLLRLAGGGPTAPSLWSWALPAAAVPALIIGADWRLHMATRLWTVYLLVVLLTWLGTRHWLGPIVLDPLVLLPMAGAALALAAGVGVVALQDDLSSYRFGWRQLLPAFTVVAVVAAVVPIALQAGNGRWKLPGTSQVQLLSWMSTSQDRRQPTFRVVWLGDASSLPGSPRRLAADLSTTVAVDGPTPQGPVPASRGGAAERLLAGATAAARHGETVDLGASLAPLQIRYLVVPLTSPFSMSASGSPVSAELRSALDSQLDLKVVESDPSLAVYENTQWKPVIPKSHRGSIAVWLLQMAEVPAWGVVVMLVLRYRPRSRPW